MIIAQVPTRNGQIAVEIVDVFATIDGRRLAMVRALQGQPFTAWSHGGWTSSDRIAVSAALLSGVAISADVPQPVLVTQEA